MKHGKTMTAAEAGPRGEKVRSDACVRVEPETSGKVVVTVRGKVASLYGDAITAQMTEGCAALGVEHARVIVDDGGALPFVLAARLEAAVRRAECGTPNAEFLLARRPGNRGPSEKGRHRRTRLYVPGGRPNFMANAHLHAPDGVILDLEDSVAPAEKDAARVMVRCALRSLDWGDAERMVRINPLPGGIRDLPFAVGHGAQMILIPKVESAAQVEEVAAECARLAHGCGEGAPWILPILESAAGVLAAAEIAAAHTTVAAVTIGLEDYTADIGAQRTAGGRESLWARCRVVAAARAAGVQPLDSVHSDVADEDGLREAVREARSLGFDGKGCIHPRQIRVVHEAFAPTAEELAHAKAVVVAFEKALSEGSAVVALGSRMIDPPVVKRALRTVDLAVGTGILSSGWREGENA